MERVCRCGQVTLPLDIFAFYHEERPMEECEVACQSGDIYCASLNKQLLMRTKGEPAQSYISVSKRFRFQGYRISDLLTARKQIFDNN